MQARYLGTQGSVDSDSDALSLVDSERLTTDLSWVMGFKFGPDVGQGAIIEALGTNKKE